MILTAKQRFSVTGDLLYPAALGAGIAWWVEAFIHWRANSPGPASTGWVLSFGVFFLLYHSRSFVILREDEAHRAERQSGAGRQPAPEYSPAEFTKDLINCIALVLAFVSLRLPDGRLDLADPLGTFAVAALIPLGSLITQSTLTPFPNASWPLRLLATLVAGAGVWHAASDRYEPVPSLVEWWVLRALLLLLAWYMVAPHHFGAPTPAQRAAATKADPSLLLWIRVTVALLALMYVSYLVWHGIRVEVT